MEGIILIGAVAAGLAAAAPARVGQPAAHGAGDPVVGGRDPGDPTATVDERVAELAGTVAGGSKPLHGGTRSHSLRSMA